MQHITQMNLVNSNKEHVGIRNVYFAICSIDGRYFLHQFGKGLHLLKQSYSITSHLELLFKEFPFHFPICHAKNYNSLYVFLHIVILCLFVFSTNPFFFTSLTYHYLVDKVSNKKSRRKRNIVIKIAAKLYDYCDHVLAKQNDSFKRTVVKAKYYLYMCVLVSVIERLNSKLNSTFAVLLYLADILFFQVSI